MGLGKVATAVVLLLVGAVCGGIGWTTYQNEQSDLENAVEIEGTVQNTAIDEDVDRRDRNDDGVRERETSYRPIVNYTYAYEGTEYASDSVFSGPEQRFGNREKAADITDRYAVGDTVTVYVNDENPSRAYLVERESSPFHLAFMGVGVLLCLGALKAAFDGLVGE